LRETKLAGFDYLELSLDETDEKLSRLDWDENEIRTVRRAIDETGVQIRSMCLSGHRRFPLGDPDEGIQRKSLDIMQNAIILSVRLGIRVIQIAGYDVYYKQPSAVTRETFAKNLRISVGMAAREGVILAFETMETPFIDTVKKAVFWINRIYSPYLQIYPDIGNITNAALIYGADVSVDLESGAGHLAALHLKETRPGVYREVPYGTGHVDFAEAAKIAWRLGVRLYVGEFWHTGGENWRKTLRDNNCFLRKVLDGAALRFKAN
jgi:L-ribulose-5-phosphate 3-epimerase/hexulose-6-phosphate isomerase